MIRAAFPFTAPGAGRGALTGAFYSRRIAANRARSIRSPALPGLSPSAATKSCSAADSTITLAAPASFSSHQRSAAACAESGRPATNVLRSLTASRPLVEA